MGILDAPGVSQKTAKTSYSKKLRPVATRAHKMVRGGSPNHISDGVSTGITTQLYHVAQISFSSLRLVFSNYYNSAGVETDGPNNITIKANIRLTGGLNYPVFFGGRRSAVCEPGAVLISDPIGISRTKGQDFFTRTYVSVTSGQFYPLGLLTNSANEGVVSGDFADGSVTTNAVRGYGPQLVIGNPAIPCASPVVLAQGDSITCGFNDSFGTTDDYGWLSRALDGKLSYLNLGLSSSAVGAAVTGTGAARRFRVADVLDFDSAILLYGTNDLAGGTALATIKSSLVSWWKIHSDRGLACYGATVPPQTTSTDSWATVGNQTPTSSNATRVSLNAWLRDGAPVDSGGVPVSVGSAGTRAGQTGHPLVATPWEFADAVESARDSGLWKAGMTLDGTHPGLTGAAAIAAVVPVTVLGALLP